MAKYPKQKLTIVGGGILGIMQAYYAWKEAEAVGEQIRVSIYERNKDLTATTVKNIVPSLTIDEMMAVIPPGPELDEKLGILFNSLGGIRVQDVEGVNDSTSALRFIEQVKAYSKNAQGHADRTQTLFELGRLSMDLWLDFYESGDDELKQILRDANFNPCRQSATTTPLLHDGYRIDLLYNMPDARVTAEKWRANYLNQGYSSCRVLSPAEVKDLDPFLSDFCAKHTDNNDTWNNDTVALYRPGGCLDTEIFLPKFYEYLRQKMGSYINAEGKQKDCFKIKFSRNVVGVNYTDENKMTLAGVKFSDERVKQNIHEYEMSEYAFCPGEAVGTMESLGFAEPAYAGFAGASLMLNIPIPDDNLEKYKAFNHCMEVHQVGVCLAWQARFRDNQIFIGVAGTKAFYGDKTPQAHEEFALNRNLLQLNMINDVLPQFISLALGRSTVGIELTAADLKKLENTNIAKRWVGTRAVGADGFLTAGAVYNDAGKITNAVTATQAGSGGVSFALGATLASRIGVFKQKADPGSPMANLMEKVVKYSNSRRCY